jgi:hypothetical protein
MPATPSSALPRRTQTHETSSRGDPAAAMIQPARVK